MKPSADSSQLSAKAFLPVVLIIVVGVAVYANSLTSPFIFDDAASISDNPSIRHLSHSLSPPNHGETVSGRPIVNLSLAINYALGGLNPAGYHAVNLGLHLGCVLLLFAIVSRATGDDVAAFACALVWMLHPLVSEVVDYTVARTESMMALCLLLTLYAAMRGWTAGAVIACAIGMACKETMVVAPIAVFLWDRCFGIARGRRRWPLYAGLASTWLVLIALLASAPRAHSAGLFAAGSALHPADSWTYLLNQGVVIVRYFRLAVWPTGLVLDYGFPQALSLADVAPRLIALLALAAIAVVALIRRPRVGFLAAFVFLTLAPSSSIVPVVTEVGAERRMYLPLMAIVVLGGLGLRALLARKHAILIAATAAIAVACGAETIARNREYASALTMWQTNVERRPNGRARSNYAAALQSAGRRDEVVPQLRAAVDDFPEARYSLGTQLIARGQPEEGLRELEQFVRDFPTHPDAADARERAAGARGQIAARLTDEALSHIAANRLNDAIALFGRVVDLLPDSANAHRNLANALLDANRYDDAIAEARIALRLNPNDPAAREIIELASAPKKR